MRRPSRRAVVASLRRRDDPDADVTEPHLAARAGRGITRLRHTGPAQPGATSGGPGRPLHVRAVMMLRRHWLVSALLAAGLALRVAVLAAYHPALIYIDSLRYLYGIYTGAEPVGYNGLLKLMLLIGDLGTVAVIQHLLGLAMAIALYIVLLRRGTARWLAALAVAPVLLDAYQLQMEQMIMPDVWFEAMIVAGLAVLLWRPAVTVPFAVAAGVILGLSATIKELGEFLVLPAVLYLMASAGGRRWAIRSSAALALGFALPILGYCSGSYALTGHFMLAHPQPHTGRLVAAADCATLKLPADVRALCPTPAEQAQGPDWLEHSGQSPLFRADVPRRTRRRLIAELDAAVISQQPLRVVAAIARDAVRLFALTREPTPGPTPISRWQFQTTYPTYPPWVTLRPGNVIVVGLQHQVFGGFHLVRLRPSYGGRAEVDRPVAAFLRSYQLDGGYTPGPLFAVLTLAGLVGSALVLARRADGPGSRGPALACLLFTATGATLLLVADVLVFSWRYQLPALVTLVPGGVLGIVAVRAARRSVLVPGRDPEPGARENLLSGPGTGPHPGGDTPQE